MTVQISKSSKIEKWGLESVPNELRKTSWFDYFILQLSFSVNSGNFLVPALAVLNGNLSFFAAVAATLAGAIASFIFVSALAMPGAIYGLPAQYAIRGLLGTGLTRFIASPIRVITSLYWFAVQTIGGTIALIEIVKKLTGTKLSLLPISLSLALTMALLALIGFEAVKKASRLFMPVLIIGQLILIYLFVHYAAVHHEAGTLFNHQWKASYFFLYSSLAFVQYISGVSASSDMARYSRTPKEAFWGLLAGNGVGFLITSLLAAFSAALIGNWNPFAGASSLIDSKWILVILMICVGVSMISINMNNAYTGGFSLLNTFHQLGRVKSSLIFGVAAIILSGFPQLVNGAQKYISYLGTFIIPLSAVIIIEYLVIKKAALSENDLIAISSGSYRINKEALCAIAAGVCSFFLIPKNFSPGFLSFLLTSCFYLAMFCFIKTKKAPR